MDKFGLYPNFYVRRKEQLFPLIETYSGRRLKNATHGEAIALYYQLLRTNPSFKNEVDAMIQAQAGKLYTNAQRVALRKEQKALAASGAYLNGSGVWGTIVDVASSLITGSQAQKESEAASDKIFYESVLAQQRASSTTRVLVIGGITVAIIGTGVFLYLKMSKR